MIIAFTKDWNDVPTCTTHILKEMSQKQPVLWVNSIGVRRPDLFKVSDLRRILQRIWRCFAGIKDVEGSISVLSPFLFPAAKRIVISYINKFLFQMQSSSWIRRHLKQGGKEQIEYWCFVPNSVSLIPSNSFIVYYCVDDWSCFHNLDGKWLSSQEKILLMKANVVFAVSRVLVEKCKKILYDLNPAWTEKVHYSPHGVNYEMFHAAIIRKENKVPEEIAGIKHPVIGFYGNLHPWIDFELLRKIIEKRPLWSFVFIGECFCDKVDNIKFLPNVIMTGRKEYNLLPAYCSCFDAAIIPYDMKQKRMESVNPVKTLELLAAGVPVVSSDIPELRNFSQDVAICRSIDEWLTALDAAVKRKDRTEISKRVETFDWKKRVEEIEEIVKKQKKNGRRTRCY